MQGERELSLEETASATFVRAADLHFRTIRLREISTNRRLCQERQKPFEHGRENWVCTALQSICFCEMVSTGQLPGMDAGPRWLRVGVRRIPSGISFGT